MHRLNIFYQWGISFVARNRVLFPHVSGARETDLMYGARKWCAPAPNNINNFAERTRARELFS